MEVSPTAPPMRAAIKQAKKSQHRFKLGAAIAKKNKVLVAAPNEPKTHPRFSSGQYKSLHAEGNAIYKAIRQGMNIEGSTVYVFRKNHNLAKPCPCCIKLMKKYGVKRVVYSNSHKTFSIIDL